MALEIYEPEVKRLNGMVINVRIGIRVYDDDGEKAHIAVFQNKDGQPELSGIFPNRELDERTRRLLERKAKKAIADRPCPRSGFHLRVLEVNRSANVAIICAFDPESGVVRAKAEFYIDGSSKRKVKGRNKHFYHELGEDYGERFIPDGLYGRMLRRAYAILFKKKGNE